MPFSQKKGAKRGLTDKEIEEQLEKLDGNVSELEGSDHEDEEDLNFDPQGENSESSSEDEEDEEEISHSSRSSSTQSYWKHTLNFEPLPPAPEYIPPNKDATKSIPMVYFSRYFPNEFFKQLSNYTNIRYHVMTGKLLNSTAEEIKKIFGIFFTMSYLKYPRMRMYWSNRTRVPMVADTMTRNRFLLLRNNLKMVDDLLVVEEQKKNDKFWKVRPILNIVRQGCLDNPRTKNISIDEQMIPFWGKAKMRQFIKGKPNPCGIKVFVACSPDGLPLDFFFYEGKGDSILTTKDRDISKLGIGGKAIMRLAHSLPQGTTIYMDRFFTSVDLLDILHSEACIQATGTLQNRQIPLKATLKSDSVMQKQGRGSIDEIVRNDGQVVIVKWMDNKSVVLASSVEGANPTDICRRWCKKDKRYVEVIRPNIIRNYNLQMGGVDLFDRVISFYRIQNRTRKWTIRVIMHMIDFAAAAGWLMMRRDEVVTGTPKKNRYEFLDFKVSLAESLIYCKKKLDETSNDGSESEDEVAQPPCKRRIIIPHPSPQLRKKDVLHMPVITDSNEHRCRLPTVLAKVKRLE